MKRRPRLFAALGVLALALIGAGLFFFLPAGLEPVQASPSQPTGRALVERGRYLATAADCVACHSVPNGPEYGGGLAFKLPFGTIYSSNITPDKQAGIGAWSDAQFVRAMRHGVRDDGQELYPAFPYTSYTKMGTDDILAIRAYLNTIPPSKATVQANQLSFPFNQRYLMRGWKLLFAKPGAMGTDASKSPEWNRGAYLVEAFGHCGECHTPRNFLYGLKNGQKFAGETQQGWKAYNITSDPTGIGSWSVDEIAAYLGTGHATNRGAASGTMAEAVELSLRHLKPEDLRAMAVYLKTIPPRDSGRAAIPDVNAPLMVNSAPYQPARPANGKISELGLRLFEGACASCHAFNGQGQQTAWAALRGAEAVNDPEGTNLIRVILRGTRLTTPEGPVVMPAFASAYSDVEVAAIVNYVLQHFGNKPGNITPRMVSDARKVSE